MAKNIIGIDISDLSIEAITLDKSRGGFKVEYYSRFRLSPEIVDNGKILNREKLKEAILKLFQNAQPRPLGKSAKVFFSIPESQTFTKVIALPKDIKDKELVQVALNKAEEIIPEATNSLISIIKVLPETANNKQVFYSAAETEVLQSFISIFNELNIEVAGITTETISSFAGIKKDPDKQNVLLLDLGAKTTIASIFTGDYLQSSINIDIGGDNISQAIAKKLKISYIRAEAKKIKIGLSSEGHGEIMLISQGQLQPLIDELKVFIKYWQETSGQNIERIILIGGLSNMVGIDKYFGDNLNLPTHLGQTFINSKDLPKGLVLLKYINALGLAKIAHQGTDIDFYKKLLQAEKTKDKIVTTLPDQKKSFKNILKNKYLWIILSILILGAGLFFFRNQPLSFYSTRNVVNVENNPVVNNAMKLDTEIVVATHNTNNYENFIAGENYNLIFNTNYSPSVEQADFNSILDNLEQVANEQILSLINQDYKQDGYYIIPKIISYDTIDISPSEVDYIVGATIEANMDYNFMMFSEVSLKDWLLKKYPNLSDNIDYLDYNIINYSISATDSSFNILVSVFFKNGS